MQLVGSWVGFFESLFIPVLRSNNSDHKTLQIEQQDEEQYEDDVCCSGRRREHVCLNFDPVENDED